MKPNFPQFTIDFQNQQIQDFEWADSNTVILAVEKCVGIFNLQQASERPYKDVVTTGLDFSIFGELAFVSDSLVRNPVNSSESRNPDLLLAQLEALAKENDILQVAPVKIKGITEDKHEGVMQLCEVDNGIRELESSSTDQFI